MKALFLGAALAVVAAPAANACQHWSVPRQLDLQQGNNISMWLTNVSQTGALFESDAKYYSPQDRGWIRGHANGEFRGDDVSIHAYWNNRTLGVYEGRVLASGKMEGTNYDRDHAGTKVNWYSLQALQCDDGAGGSAPPSTSAHGPIRHVPPRKSEPTTTAHGPIRHVGKASPAPCISGFVWRQAGPNDYVCVKPYSRARANLDNGRGAERVDPNGAYGPDSCVSGYVWREAFEGDHVCVRPDVRSETAEENRLAPERRQH